MARGSMHKVTLHVRNEQLLFKSIYSRISDALTQLYNFLVVQMPVLETPQGSLFESVAISRYIASMGPPEFYALPLNPAGDLQCSLFPS